MIGKVLVRLLKVIALLTIVSGLVQMIKPQWVLAIVGGDVSAATNHFFAIVGMFMVLFGGLLWQSLAAASPQPMPVMWCGLQKFGAAVAVGLGVFRDLFSWLALGVAAFDLLSAVLIFYYWFSIRRVVDAHRAK